MLCDRRARRLAVALASVLGVCSSAVAQQPDGKPQPAWLEMFCTGGLSTTRPSGDTSKNQEPSGQAEDVGVGAAEWPTVEVERFGPFTRIYRTRQDFDRLNRERQTVRNPGPPLAGKFDHEMLRWMDVESFADTLVRSSYRGLFYGEADVAGQHRDIGFTQHELAVQCGEAINWGATEGLLRVKALAFAPRPILPDSQKRFPGQLVDVRAGVTFPWLYPPGLWNFTLGSASDKPFASDHEMVADVTWLLGSPPSGEKDTIVVFVNWQNNRDFLNCWPFPGFVYRYKEGDWLTLVTGFPYEAVAWRPTPRLELSASYVFPRMIYSEIAYRPHEALRLHLGFDWTHQSYYRHERHHIRDRLWYDEKRLTLGLRWQITGNAFLDVSGGYAFDRLWWEGRDLEDRHADRINVADGPFVGLRLGVMF